MLLLMPSGIWPAFPKNRQRIRTRTKKQYAHIATLLVCSKPDGRLLPAFCLTHGRELLTTPCPRNCTKRRQSSKSALDSEVNPTPSRAPLLSSAPMNILIPPQIPIRLVSPFDFRMAPFQSISETANGRISTAPGAFTAVRLWPHHNNGVEDYRL
jgi:hypothetical protein